MYNVQSHLVKLAMINQMLVKWSVQSTQERNGFFLHTTKEHSGPLCGQRSILSPFHYVFYLRNIKIN